MTHDIYVTIKLDEYYQQFLRGYYDCYDDIFVFPRLSRKNYLPHALIEALWYPPKNYKIEDFGSKTFRIGLPEIADKDIYSMNYISTTANNAFVSVIEKFYYKTWYKFADDKYIVGYGQKEIVNLFMERYNIDPKYNDRLLRDYSRFKNWNCQRKRRKKISISSVNI